MRNGERHSLHMVNVGPCNLKSTDSEGRELETCYEKMRLWLTVGCQLGCLATRNGSAVTHWFLSLLLSLPPPTHGAEKWGKAEAPIARTISASNVHAMIFFLPGQSSAAWKASSPAAAAVQVGRRQHGPYLDSRCGK